MNHENTFDSSLKVKLQSIVNRDDRIVFNVSPAVSETQVVNYQPIQPVHAPGATQVYTTSGSRIFTLQPVILVSRTPEEATRNLYTLNLIRSWSKPYFGNSSDLLGAPPDVLEFSAYSTTTRKGNIHKVPVVLTNFGINYPNDVDYIPTKAGTEMMNKDIQVANKYQYIDGGVPFPTVMQIDITLIETHSANEYANVFDLQQYKNGVLKGF